MYCNFKHHLSAQRWAAHSLIAFCLSFSLAACQTLTKKSEAEKAPLSLKSVWARQTTLEDNIQFRSYLLAAPLIYKDLVIVSNSHDGVSAFTKIGGEREWVFKSSLGSDSGLTLFEDHLFFVSNQGELICLDPNNGRVKWKFAANAEGFSAPIVLNEKVVFMTSDGRLFALDVLKGQQIWTIARTSETNLSTRAGASLTTDSKDIYAAFPNGSVMKLTSDKGTPLWESKIPGGLRFKDVDTTPLIFDQKLIVSGFETGVHALDLQTGQIIWNIETSTYQNVIPYQKNLLVADLKGSLHLIEASTGATLKSFAVGTSPLGRPLVLGDSVVVSESKGPIRLLSLLDGHVESIFDTGHGVSAPITFDSEEKSLFAISQSSNLYKILIRPSEYGKVWTWEN